jgi:hypothetical protein
LEGEELLLWDVTRQVLEALALRHALYLDSKECWRLLRSGKILLLRIWGAASGVSL